MGRILQVPFGHVKNLGAKSNAFITSAQFMAKHRIDNFLTMFNQINKRSQFAFRTRRNTNILVGINRAENDFMEGLVLSLQMTNIFSLHIHILFKILSGKAYPHIYFYLKKTLSMKVIEKRLFRKILSIFRLFSHLNYPVVVCSSFRTK